MLSMRACSMGIIEMHSYAEIQRGRLPFPWKLLIKHNFYQVGEMTSCLILLYFYIIFFMF